MASKTILALAVGDPKSSQRIDHPTKLEGVRPYIRGLIDGLASLGPQLGTDFVIDYRQNWLDYIEKGQAFRELPDDPALIYAMSTKVMRAAGDHTEAVPIVFPNCSEHGDEEFVKAGRATGFSAQRTQTAGDCFDLFLTSVPTLKQVLIPHIDEHDICENALQLVTDAAIKKGVEPKPVLVRSYSDLLDKLSNLPPRDRGNSATTGVHVLPVDLFFGATVEIIKRAQGEKNLPAFFPTTDWVPVNYGGAFGGYGVPQYKCGERTAQHVHQILWVNPPDAKFPVVTEATEQDFEWAVGRAAAAALDIEPPVDDRVRLI
jgi:ABC-type uncharacterized transport system substrate-binding protein